MEAICLQTSLLFQVTPYLWQKYIAVLAKHANPPLVIWIRFIGFSSMKVSLVEVTSVSVECTWKRALQLLLFFSFAVIYLNISAFRFCGVVVERGGRSLKWSSVIIIPALQKCSLWHVLFSSNWPVGLSSSVAIHVHLSSLSLTLSVHLIFSPISPSISLQLSPTPTHSHQSARP